MQWSLMSDAVGCYAATAERPGSSRQAGWHHESRHRYVNSAEAANDSLVTDELDAPNSMSNRPGRVSGYCAPALPMISFTFSAVHFNSCLLNLVHQLQELLNLDGGI